MGTLSKAVREERWQVAAYCLLRALVRATELLPEDTVPALLDMLEGNAHERP